MKGKIVIVILAVLFCTLLSACSTKPSQYTPSNNPPKDLDFNNDSVSDFRIVYIQLVFDGTGPESIGEMIEGDIVPLNNTMILKKQETGSLFDTSKDTVHFQMNVPYSWESVPLKVDEIKTIQNVWPDHWTLDVREIRDYYYLAFLIQGKSGKVLGWMKLKLDDSTGTIEVISTRITDQDFLVIGA